MPSYMGNVDGFDDDDDDDDGFQVIIRNLEPEVPTFPTNRPNNRQMLSSNYHLSVVFLSIQKF